MYAPRNLAPAASLKLQVWISSRDEMPCDVHYLELHHCLTSAKNRCTEPKSWGRSSYEELLSASKRAQSSMFTARRNSQNSFSLLGATGLTIKWVDPHPRYHKKGNQPPLGYVIFGHNECPRKLICNAPISDDAQRKPSELRTNGPVISISSVKISTVHQLLYG